MKRFLLFGFVLIVACTEDRSDPYAPRSLSRGERQEIIETVKKRLRDAGSAKFELPELVTPQTGIHPGIPITYCGLVNARNAFGGYTGDQIFTVKLTWERDGSLLATFQDIDNQNLALCREKGYFQGK